MKCFRLSGFDYSRPFFYLVTLKKLPGLPPFCSIVAPGKVEPTPITVAFEETIRAFAAKWRAVEKIWPCVVMPDHLHLMIKLKKSDEPKPLGLPRLVALLRKDLTRAYWGAQPFSGFGMAGGAAISKTGAAAGKEGSTFDSAAISKTGAAAGKEGFGSCSSVLLGRVPTRPLRPVFDSNWHDWVVKREGQLATFTRYVLENASRHWLRKSNARYFRKARPVEFLGRSWFAYGNLSLLDSPVIEPFRCSRSWAENGPEWRRAVARASRIGPGGVGIGTFMSPCEKACGRAIGEAGGRWAVLAPEGFGERWHPYRGQEKACADGRLLYLSLYPAAAREPTRAELYKRCHEMGDWVVEKLGMAEGSAISKTGAAAGEESFGSGSAAISKTGAAAGKEGDRP